MKNHTLRYAALAAATFGWISLASAQGPEGGPMRQSGPGFGPGPGGPPMGMIAKRLGLTDEQKAQWKAIHEKEREAGQPLMESARAAREAFDQALESGNPDPATVGKAAIAMREAREKLEAHHKATLEEVKAILTPEQLAQFEEMHKRGPRGGPDGQGPRRRGPGRSR